MLKGAEFLIKPEDANEVFTPEDFSDEQKQMAETTEKFVAEKAIPFIEEIDAGNYDKVVELMKEAGELGLLMIDGPEEYGGLNLDKATSMLVAEKNCSRWIFFCCICSPYRDRDPSSCILWDKKSRKKNTLKSF